MKDWDIYQDKFIHNDEQKIVCLIILGLIDIDYVPLEAKVLYEALSNEEKEYIKKRIENAEGILKNAKKEG